MTHAEWQYIADMLNSVEDLINEGRFSDVVSVLLECVGFLFDQVVEPEPDPDPPPPDPPPPVDVNVYTDSDGDVVVDDQGNEISAE